MEQYHKERIKNLNIVKFNLKKYISFMPWNYQAMAYQLIKGIDEDLEFYKNLKKKKDEKEKQLSLI